MSSKFVSQIDTLQQEEQSQQFWASQLRQQCLASRVWLAYSSHIWEAKGKNSFWYFGSGERGLCGSSCICSSPHRLWEISHPKRPRLTWWEGTWASLEIENWKSDRLVFGERRGQVYKLKFCVPYCPFVCHHFNISGAFNSSQNHVRLHILYT